MWRQWTLIAILALAAGTGGLFLGRWLDQREPAGTPAPVSGTDVVGQPRPAFELRGLDGNLHRASEWDGRVVLLNFWATWCAPCREEMPMLNELQAEHGGRGLQVVGIALDTPGAVQAFADKLGIDFPILMDAVAGDDLARRYGNAQGVLPYTVLIDRDGTVRETMFGALEKAPLERRLDALL